MATVTVRVDEETKKEMERLGSINWSEVMRRAITEAIEREKMMKASQAIDALRAKSKRKWDSVAVIREWREKRR